MAHPNAKIKGPCERGRAAEDRHGKPIVIMCNRTGRWRPYGLMPFGTILCDDCYVTMLLRDREPQDAR